AVAGEADIVLVAADVDLAVQDGHGLGAAVGLHGGELEAAVGSPGDQVPAGPVPGRVHAVASHGQRGDLVADPAGEAVDDRAADRVDRAGEAVLGGAVQGLEAAAH